MLLLTPLFHPQCDNYCHLSTLTAFHLTSSRGRWCNYGQGDIRRCLRGRFLSHSSDKRKRYPFIQPLNSLVRSYQKLLLLSYKAGENRHTENGRKETIRTNPIPPYLYKRILDMWHNAFSLLFKPLLIGSSVYCSWNWSHIVYL